MCRLICKWLATSVEVFVHVLHVYALLYDYDYNFLPHLMKVSSLNHGGKGETVNLDLRCPGWDIGGSK